MYITKKANAVYYFVSLIISLLIFRTGFPLFKYVFSALYVLFLIYMLWNFRIKLINNIKYFSRHFLIIFLLVFVYILAVLFSDKLYISQIKEILNIGLLLSIFYFLFIILEDSQALKTFISNFKQVIIIVTLFISSIILIEKYHYICNSNNAVSILGSGLGRIDYNFSLLPVFFSMFIIYEKLLKSRKLYENLILNFLLVFFTSRILLSGSKRGELLFFLLFFIYTILLVYSIFRKHHSNWRKQIVSNGYWYFVYLALIVIVLRVVLTSPIKSDNIHITQIERQNKIAILKSHVSGSIFRVVTLFYPNASFLIFHCKLWSLTLDPKNPDTGWGTKVHKSVFPLRGKNVENIPKGTIGYLIDSRSASDIHIPSNYIDIYTDINNLKVKTGEKYIASVYCYVSEDFDGLSARLLLGWKAVKQGMIKQNTASQYQLNNRGTWQYLTIEFESMMDGSLPVYISVTHDNGADKSFKGQVIFAYPICKELECHDTLSSDMEIDTTHFNKLPLKLFNENAFDKRNLYKAGIGFPELFLSLFQKGLFDKLGSSIDIKDSTYNAFKTDLNTSFQSDNGSSSRLNRWKFAIEIYKKEYNIIQKLIGNGFNFLSWYGKVFKEDYKQIDYPHNPILHILLYSGIIGLVLYLIFLAKVILLYLKYRQYYPLLFLFFIITFYFTFFSGGNPFSPPLMGFLIMFPFLIDIIHIKYKESEESNILS